LIDFTPYRTITDEHGNVTYFDMSWEEVRAIRNHCLEITDWWALKDLTMSQEKKDYRTALRDLPQEHDEANDAADNWPVAPDE